MLANVIKNVVIHAKEKDDSGFKTSLELIARHHNALGVSAEHVPIIIITWHDMTTSYSTAVIVFNMHVVFAIVFIGWYRVGAHRAYVIGSRILHTSRRHWLVTSVQPHDESHYTCRCTSSDAASR